MAAPQSREEFKNYCLRKLGAPVNNIEVDDEQIEDRIDEALQFFRDYHFEGSQRTYYKHLITQEDIDNKYITLPENIFGAVRIFPPTGEYYSGDMLYDANFQIAVQDMFALQNATLVPYYMLHQHLGIIREMLVVERAIRYSKHKNKLYVDTNWNKFKVGSYFIVEAHEVIDPEEYTSMWSDRWLQNYCTVLIKEQWGLNLTKFSGVSLLGGVQFNAERLLTDAQNEKSRLEEDMIRNLSVIPLDLYG